MAVKTITGFLDKIAKLPSMPNGFYSFRGERDANWQTLPGIYRPENKKLQPFEKEIVRDLIAAHPQEFYDDRSMFDQLVRMQHYGLPTRLLDMTANPLAALFFATFEKEGSVTDGKVSCMFIPNERKKYFDSDTVSCLANLSNLSEDEKEEIAYAIRNKKSSMSVRFFNSKPEVDRLLQFIRVEKPYFRSDIEKEELDCTWYVVPKSANRRLIAQNGSFVIFGLSKRRKRLQGTRRMPITAIRIHRDFKGSIRKSLETLGVHASALFPEIDSAAKYISERYRNIR